MAFLGGGEPYFLGGIRREYRSNLRNLRRAALLPCCGRSSRQGGLDNR